MIATIVHYAQRCYWSIFQQPLRGCHTLSPAWGLYPRGPIYYFNNHKRFIYINQH